MRIKIKKLRKSKICAELFQFFDRHQEVTRCLRKEAGEWTEKEIAFTEDWGEEEKKQLAQCLKKTVEDGGAVYGALEHGKLVGFASVEQGRFGRDRCYVELSSLHVSNGYRGSGIGRRLFLAACRSAQRMGARKLYISSHSAVETQKFYRSMGCVEAEEYKEEAVEKEPCDCQLECLLDGTRAYRGIFLLLGAAAGGVYGNQVLARTIPGIAAGLCFAAVLTRLLDNKRSRLG